jgi:hypothetical protein
MLFQEKRWEQDNFFLQRTLNPLELEHLKVAGEDVYTYISVHLQDFYPNFEKWYRHKVIPGFIAGQRDINIIADKDTFGGIAITKHSQEQDRPNKISTFFIAPEKEGSGFDTALLSLSLGQLRQNGNSNRVILTLPEEQAMLEKLDYSPFSNFILNQGFSLVDVVQDKYRPQKSEYVFCYEL